MIHFFLSLIGCEIIKKSFFDHFQDSFLDLTDISYFRLNKLCPKYYVTPIGEVLGLNSFFGPMLNRKFPQVDAIMHWLVRYFLIWQLFFPVVWHLDTRVTKSTFFWVYIQSKYLLVFFWKGGGLFLWDTTAAFLYFELGNDHRFFHFVQDFS